jgi:nucleolar protein 9
MPKENRKRGKKNKKKSDESEPPLGSHLKQLPKELPNDAPSAEQHEGPSWIISAPTRQSEEVDGESPFGFVDAELKGYFKTVDLQIRDWQESQTDGREVDDSDLDPNEGLHVPV